MRVSGRILNYLFQIFLIYCWTQRERVLSDLQKDVNIVFWACCILPIWGWSPRFWHASVLPRSCTSVQYTASVLRLRLRTGRTHYAQHTTTTSLCWSSNISSLVELQFVRKCCVYLPCWNISPTPVTRALGNELMPETDLLAFLYIRKYPTYLNLLCPGLSIRIFI
jgi:hypothetical protein